MQTVGWKIILSITLFISFIFFSFTVVESLQNRNIPVRPGQGSPTKKQPFSPPVNETRFYPSVPARLPDLSAGYLFNQERKIESAETAESIATDDTAAIDVEEVRYAGSLISGTMRKGLIRFPVAAIPLRRRASARVAVAGGRKPAAANWSSRVVEEGETLNGYKVASISPEAIVFEQGGRQLEKKLYTPDKERTVYIPPMNRAKPVQRNAVRQTNRSYQPGTKARPASTSSSVRTPVTTRSTVRR